MINVVTHYYVVARYRDGSIEESEPLMTYEKAYDEGCSLATQNRRGYDNPLVSFTIERRYDIQA